MIKIVDYIRDQEFLEVYGECDVYAPGSFDEYFSIKQVLDEIYESHDSLIDILVQQYLAEGSLPGEGVPFVPNKDLNPEVARFRREPISREKILWGRKVIKALMQVPYTAMPGMLGRTLMSTDPVLARYVGEGFYGALKHREKTGQPLSNYTCEMRYASAGQPNVSIWDPVTLSPVPILGAVLSPGRAAVVNRAGNGPVPNPHRGYLYDGKDDDGKVLFNGPGDTGGLQNSSNMAKGVLLPYKSMVHEIETAVGKPLYYYGSPEDRKPMRKVGKVGTSLAPPVPGQPDSYTHTLNPKTGVWEPSVIPAAAGYNAKATLGGGRRRLAGEPYEPEPGEGSSGISYQVGNTGGAQTFEKQFRKIVQAQAETPYRFDRRTQRFLQHRNQQLAAGNDTYTDLQGNPVKRKPNNLVMQDPGEVTGPYQHRPHRDEKGKVRRRQPKMPVPGDPRRSMVEPAIREPMDATRKQSLLAYYDSKIDALSGSNSDQARKLLASYQRLRSNLVNPQPGIKLGTFGKGYEKVDSGEVYDKTHRLHGKEKTVVKREIGKDAAGNDVEQKVKQKQPLPVLRGIIPNLYTLSPAPDTNNPVLISAALAKQVMEATDNPTITRLTDGDDEIGDRLVRKNFGSSREENSGSLKFRVGVKKGDRYMVHVVNKIFGKYPCCFAATDQNGDVMFTYKPNTKVHEQPVLSPGRLEQWIGVRSNPTAFGGHEAAPASSTEMIPYENQERTNRSLYGPQNPDGTWNTNQDPKKQAIGWQRSIIRNVTKGVQYGIHSKSVPEWLRKKYKENMDEFTNDTFILATNNLKNGKFLDTGEGYDVHFHLGYLHRQFPHFYAVIRQLDNLVSKPRRFATSDDPEEINGIEYFLKSRLGDKLPSQMTMTEFQKWIGDPGVREVLDTPVSRSQRNMPRAGERPQDLSRGLVNVRMNTNYLTTFRKGIGAYKKKYGPENFLYQVDRNGNPINHEDGAPIVDQTPEQIQAARGGYTGLVVTAPQIEQMMADVRNFYCKWMGKDMVAKVAGSETAKNSRRIRSGSFAEIGAGRQTATVLAREADELDAARQGDVSSHAPKSGINRLRGRFDQFLEERRMAPEMLRRQHQQAQAAFEANPIDEDLAIKAIRLAIKKHDADIELLAVKRLTAHVMSMQRIGDNPDTKQPWTEDSAKLYIIKHFPEMLDEIKKEIDEGELTKLQILKAATRHASVATPETILAKLKSSTPPETASNPLYKKMGEIIVASSHDDVTSDQRKKAMKFAFDIAADKFGGGVGFKARVKSRSKEAVQSSEIPQSIDPGVAVGIENAVEYHALATLIDNMTEHRYTPHDLELLRNSVDKFYDLGVLSYFVHAARILLTMHDTQGIK